jgi:hypothetical protein
MLTAMHEVLVDLFQSQPSLAVELLSGPFRLEVPEHESVELSAADLTKVVPAEFRADAVLLLRWRGKPVLGVVVEVQLSPEKPKHWAWPAYLISLRTRFKCEVALLVVCPDKAVAAWCAKPIRLGPPNWTLTPLVLGPDLVPVVTDPDLAQQHPHLTMLSAIAHSEHPDRDQILHALLTALDTLDQDTAARYTDHVLAVLTKAARDHLEALMTAGTYEYKSDFARRYYHQGQTEGRSEGRTEGEVRALLAILNTRGIPVPDDAHTRITTCTDLDHLDIWIRRAITATKIQDLFHD